AGETRGMASSAARPPLAATTLKPSSSRPEATVLRMAGSSSTSRTTGPSATPDDLAVAADDVDAVGDHGVAALAAGDAVDLAVPGIDAVVAVAADDRVAAGTAEDAVVAGPAEQRVVAGPAAEDVVAGVAEDRG